MHPRPIEKTKALGWTAQMYRLKKVWVEVFFCKVFILDETSAYDLTYTERVEHKCNTAGSP